MLIKKQMRDTDDKKRDANNMKSRYLQYEASCCRFMIIASMLLMVLI